MEATTPPNTPGFKKKPTRKNRKTFRGRNSGYRKLPDITMDASMPSEATAWLYGSIMGMSATAVQPATAPAE